MTPRTASGSASPSRSGRPARGRRDDAAAQAHRLILAASRDRDLDRRRELRARPAGVAMQDASELVCERDHPRVGWGSSRHVTASGRGTDEPGDPRRDARVAVPVDDEVTRRDHGEVTRATKAEPRTAALAPRAAMAVACGLDRLVADRHAHERRRAPPGRTLRTAELLRTVELIQLTARARTPAGGRAQRSRVAADGRPTAGRRARGRNEERRSSSTSSFIRARRASPLISGGAGNEAFLRSMMKPGTRPRIARRARALTLPAGSPTLILRWPGPGSAARPLRQ